MASTTQSQSPTFYEVYKLQFKLSLQDPDMPSPRYHHVLFVRSNPTDGSGIKFHVTGDIASSGGMVYRAVPYHDFKHSKTLHNFQRIGYTPAQDFKRRWDAALAATETPPQQKAFNPKTMKTEPFRSRNPLTFYQPGEQRQPLWKCTEWTDYKAIPALKNAGLIVQGSSPASSRPVSRAGSG